MRRLRPSSTLTISLGETPLASATARIEPAERPT
jgi:hypothetical protein